MRYERPVWAEINLNAIGKNIGTIKKLISPDTRFMAVVKADGYGHGAIEVSKEALRWGVDRLGVALPEEGVALRKAGITAPVQILGEMHPSAASLVVEYNLIPTICSKVAADALAAEANLQNKSIQLHIKVDTGMNRLGLFPDDVPLFMDYLKQLPCLEVEGIYTHFACADDPESNYTKKQLSKFMHLISDLQDKNSCPPLRHAANSAATIFLPQSHLDMVRIGIALYGLHPSDATKAKINLEPALSLITSISQIKPLLAGEGVSYSLTHVATRDSVLGLLALGYADGYSRRLSNRAEVLIGGCRAPVVGNICMDQLLVDISDIEGTKVGDEVVLIGKQNTQEIAADELAGILGTINYEITCMISNRVPRKHKRK